MTVPNHSVHGSKTAIIENTVTVPAVLFNSLIDIAQWYVGAETMLKRHAEEKREYGTAGKCENRIKITRNILISPPLPDALTWLAVARHRNRLIFLPA